MSTIRREISVGASAEEAWDAVRDFGNLHERLAPGFVTDTQLDGSDRLVTFFNGVVVRERLIALDDDGRRLVWSIVDGPYEHHNGSLEVLADGAGSRLVWTTDLLPEAATERTAGMMAKGLEAVRAKLDE